MKKRFAAVAIVVAAIGAAAGLFASPSNGASSVCPTPPPEWGPAFRCLVSLTATGPSPSTVKLHPGDVLLFRNDDSVTHMVVFANGCTFPV
jgi:plastocyanin